MDKDQDKLIMNEIGNILEEDNNPKNQQALEFRLAHNKSAPARMRTILNENTLFCFQSKFGNFFEQDIRLENNYEDFYKSFSDRSKLPPPIRSSFWGSHQQQEGIKNSNRNDTNSGKQSLPRKNDSLGFNFPYNGSKFDKDRFIQEKVSKYYDVSDYKKKVFQLAKDQYGCRFLQTKLEEGSEEVFNSIFQGVYRHVVKLMSDPFGNYLCQKLLEKSDDDNKTKLVKACSTNLVDISTNIHGTRAVQRLIELVTTEEQKSILINSLRNFVVHLIKDLYGNHVIQKILRVFSSKDKQFIYDAIAKSVDEVATHKHGCCVIQRCFDFSSDEQKVQLVREISVHALAFVKDPFGNYVIQYVLNLNVGGWNKVVISKFIGNLFSLSRNKFSSNVMEKCLKIADKDSRNKMIEEIMKMKRLPELLKDPFGNYVIQTAIALSNPRQLKQFNITIRPLLHLIKNTKYIESKLSKQRFRRMTY